MKIVKCVTVGDGSVGKTSLITKYTMQSMRDEYIPTVYDTYVDTSFLQDYKEPLLLELWDTGGSIDHDRYRKLSYPATNVVLICFSTVSRDSFENVESRWYPEIQRYCPNASICLVGMKLDLLDDKETRDKLTKENSSPILRFEGLELAQKIGAYKYCECSAKTEYGLQNVFNKAVYATMKIKFLKDENFWEDHHEDKRRSNVF